MNIFKKVLSAVLCAMDESSVLVSSFEFNSIICKRSIETAARKHPVSEQEDTNDLSLRNPSSIEQAFEERIAVFKQPVSSFASDKETAGEGGESSKIVECPEKRIYDLLSNEPQSIDQLIAASRLEPKVVIATVSILELTDLASLVPGNRVILSKEHLSAQLPQLNLETQARINQVIWFIRKFFHGVSRKYIQIYLAAYWCFVDRVRWAKGALFQQCCQTAGIDMRTFVSPIDLRFCDV
ncbi:MAG: hypothetical protein HYX67_09690 [Candidatus Melainabacteria bacterium]|nr:hypothetical protein [Candidatus Melainabacteria bacterium]